MGAAKTLGGTFANVAYAPAVVLFPYVTFANTLKNAVIDKGGKE